MSLNKLNLQYKMRNLQLSNVRINREVKRYSEWLVTLALRNSLTNDLQEQETYAENAIKVVKFNGKDIRVFAPFRPEHSALQTVTPGQAMLLGATAVVIGISLFWFRMETLTATMALVTTLYLGQLLLNMVLATVSLNGSSEE